MKVHEAPPVPESVAAAPASSTCESRHADAERPVRLRLSGVRKRFGTVVAVNGFDLEVGEGELVALVGPSGCGKTTTLRLIAGFEEPDAGTIDIAGARVAGPDRVVPPERRQVGMVFQDYALFPHLTVARNVAFGLPRDPNRQARVNDALGRVGLQGLGDRLPYQLSGGQQQRVALARAIAPRPSVILLDEPFSNLDPRLRQRVREDVRKVLADIGATAVLVTHDQEEALSLADRVAVMLEGRIAQIDQPDALYHRPVDPAVSAFIGDACFLPGHGFGDRVETSLGTLSLAVAMSGPVDVLIRPEQLRVLPGTSACYGVPGVVTRRQFHGRDQSLTISVGLDTLTARIGHDRSFDTGDEVRVGVKGSVVAFPSRAATGS